MIKESSVIGKGRDGTEYKLERLVDSEVDEFHCGTLATGWLSGGHPTVAEGEVDRIVNFHRSHQTKSTTGESMSRLSTGTPTASTSWLTLPTATLDTAQNKN